MPVIPTNTGTVNPDGGVQGLATFAPADTPVVGVDGVRGHVPAPPTGTPTTYVLRADATWGPAAGTVVLIPVLVFTGSATGGTGQTFTSPYFAGNNPTSYSLAQDIQLFFRDPAIATNPWQKLTGAPNGTQFTLNTTAQTITVNYNLPANAQLFIDSKVLGSAALETYYILQENLDRFLTEDGANLLRKEQSVLVYEALMQSLASVQALLTNQPPIE